MPELPEVESVRRQLAPLLEGRRFERVEVSDPRLTRPADPAAVARSLEGERVAVLGRIDGAAVPPARDRVLAGREREERGDEHNDGQTVQTMAHRFGRARLGARRPPGPAARVTTLILTAIGARS